MSHMRPTLALGILIAAYLALCGVYTAKTPYRQSGVLVNQGGQTIPDIGAPDERQHANYVQHLLGGKGFPVLVPGSPDLGETYQSHQPPLYYLLACGWAKLVASDPVDPDSGRRLRFLNALFGVGTLLGIFFAARWGLQDDGAGLAAVAIAGLMPMFVALHAAVGNDPLLYLLCTWTVALCAKGVREGWNWRLALGVGLTAGLGLLTKTTAVALLPTVLVALVSSWRWSDSKPAVTTWAVALLVPLVVASPWLVRNQSLYGDPLAVTAFNAAFVGSPKPETVVVPERIFVDQDPVYIAAAERATEANPEATPQGTIDAIVADVGLTPAAKFDYWVDWVGWWTGRSFIGVFGYMDVFLLERGSAQTSPTLYRVCLAALLLLAVGWALSLRAGLDGPSKAVHATNAALLLVVAVLFVRFNLQYFQGQARYLYPAIAPLAIGFGLGLSYWMGRRKAWAWGVAALALSVLQLVAVQTLMAGFEARVR